MCRYRSGEALYINGVVDVRTLQGDDNHTDIRREFAIRDGVGHDRHAPFEFQPTTGLDDYASYELTWDAGRPDWATPDIEQRVRDLMTAVVRSDDLADWHGNLWLLSLTSLPEGVTLSAGGDLNLDSLTSLPEGAQLSAANVYYAGAWHGAIKPARKGKGEAYVVA